MIRTRLIPVLLSALTLGCGFGDTNDSDGSPPGILITQPSATTVHDLVAFAANVIDDRGVAVVEFYVGETLLHTDFVEPYETTWNTLTTPNGQATLRVIARDFSGNQSLTSKTVTVSNGPS